MVVEDQTRANKKDRDLLDNRRNFVCSLDVVCTASSGLVRPLRELSLSFTVKFGKLLAARGSSIMPLMGLETTRDHIADTEASG